MSMAVYLVRHAIKAKAVGDVPITSDGVTQACSTAAYFADIPLSAIIASPLQRAQETAAYLAENHSLPVIVDERLRERANWGDLPGQSFHEFVEMWDRSTRDPEYKPPIGDSAKQAGKRLSSLLLELANQHPLGSHITVVTHGGLITDYLVHSFPEHVLNGFHPQFIAEQSSLVPECSITKLTVEGTQVSIEYFAAVGHLKGD